ncbi:hypothetical protein [Adhaeribacter pallidiroseus]|uniref:Uncharacterized protein n=1 Tax=Adhaeribacter pallidiroseus TaxID=2072847 RepID=A0A369QHX7_9BACT|nr:hypothetical protein [Adhaeribacter pallidiroseus]RDC64324.1 hypothetical protein AHMF7616_02937 [Adhaeribacter pallidiroseus]
MTFRPTTFSTFMLTQLWIALAFLGSVLTFSGEATVSTVIPVSGPLSGLVVPEYISSKKAISYRQAVFLTSYQAVFSYCFCQYQPAQTVFRHLQLSLIKLKLVTRLYHQLKAQNQCIFLNFSLSYPEEEVLARLA